MSAKFNFRSVNSCLLVFLFTFFTAFGYETDGSPSDNYRIHIDANSKKKAIVECEITLEDDKLYMSPIGANQFPSRWAHFVNDLEAWSMKGEPIKIDTLAGSNWKIHADPGSRIKLKYRINLDHEDFKWSGGIDGAAYARDWGVFYTGRSIFIMNGQQKKDITVEFDIPKKWKVSSPWTNSLSQPLVYSVNNLTTLSDSMFFAGTHEEYRIQRENFELIFAFGGAEIIVQKDKFTSMAEGIMDYYINLMGGVPNPSPEDAFDKSIVILNSSSNTDGEVIGNHISILLKENGDMMSEMIGRFIFAHEFFHLWNGKSFTPAGNDCEWFKEGVTNYYTLKALYHIGFLDKNAYLKTLNDLFYQRYDKDKGVGVYSLTQGDLKHDHWGLIYSGGMFAGIAQDMIIRSSTSNKNSLDNIMRHLYKKYGGTNEGYDLDELESLLSEASETDQAEFFKDHILGTKRIPLYKYLNMGGFDAEETDGSLLVQLKKEQNGPEKELSDGFFGVN
ncbi:hypothetical protein [Lutimonas zeaxanthinifaciens]|uniref:M61 family metallopeptidase n=1 Tax=Lutimonas zeaxanthinifaciens TaxID=3060215 RepID=UPI00265D0E6D|nr:hypothetical protein [Lutimonas sp. YSD2104]WKK66054.1 hypothetical protein QZH61_00165 [Lutimonas sp. YSD2104]